MQLFHITTRAAWERALAAGEYRAASLEAEGFIHLSTADQWLRVANARFRGQRGLVLLALQGEALRAELRLEEADGDRFPHLYGPLNLEAVTEVLDLPPAEDGTFRGPGGRGG